MKRVLGVIVTVLVVLMITSNVLLWQIADQTGDDGGSGDGGGPQQTAQPALPQPIAGTSNKATASELDRLADVLDEQFKVLEQQLGPLAGAASAAGELPNAFGSITTGLDQLAAQGNSLGGLSDGVADLAQQGQAFGDAANSLDDVAASTRRLRTVQQALTRMRDSISAVEANTGNLNDTTTATNTKLDQSNAGIASTNTSLADMIARVTETNARIGDLTELTKNVDRVTGEVGQNTAAMSNSITSMDTTITGMRSDIQQLNTNLVNLFNVICSDPAAPPGCP